jgi:hypothetical protein
MVCVSEASSGVGDWVDPPSVVVERLERFAAEVLRAAMNRPVQMVNGGMYLRGLIADGARKSLEPLVERRRSGGRRDLRRVRRIRPVCRECCVHAGCKARCRAAEL